MQNDNLPSHIILLYEKVFLDEGNYAGNYRFAFTSDGQFFFNKNKQFTPSSDSHWDTPFPSEAKIVLSKENSATLLEVVQSVNWDDLYDEYPQNTDLKNFNYFESWSYFSSGYEVKETVIWADQRPEILNKLKSDLDTILQKNKRD